MAFKEIVTKAIIGKGKKYFKNNYNIAVSDNPTTVLGCWVINHKFKGYKTKGLFRPFVFSCVFSPDLQASRCLCLT